MIGCQRVVGDNPSYKWMTPTSPTYNQGYNLLRIIDGICGTSFIVVVVVGKILMLVGPSLFVCMFFCVVNSVSV